MTESTPKSLFDLRGSVAIITGAARGNGRAIAEGLAAVGVAVVLADILADELDETARAIGNGNKTVLAVRTDLCRISELKRLVDRTIKAFGRIDILVNCAAIAGRGRSEVFDDKLWHKVFEVNATAAFRLSKLAAAHMIRQKSGAIINITSVAAELGFPADPAYPASKAALRQLTRCLATDWARYNIRVNNLCPGYFPSNMTRKSWSNPSMRAVRSDRCMLRRWGDAKELVGPVIFLASAASSFMTGNDLHFDGGLARTGFCDGD